VGKLRNLAVLIAKIRPKWGLMGNVDKLGVLGVGG
jgi:hypothetical protein